MTYYFTGECDDDILLHWRVSRWHITSMQCVMMKNYFTEECQDGISLQWTVSLWHYFTEECHNDILLQ